MTTNSMGGYVTNPDGSITFTPTDPTSADDRAKAAEVCPCGGCGPTAQIECALDEVGAFDRSNDEARDREIVGVAVATALAQQAAAARADERQRWTSAVEGLAEDGAVDLSHAWMEYQGYTPEQIAAAEEMTHEKAGCEFESNHLAWQCTDEHGRSLHPDRDALEEAAAFAVFAVDFAAARLRGLTTSSEEETA